MNSWEETGIEFDGITTGFIGSKEQIGLVVEFFKRFKKENTLAVVDPVMGDYGKLYSSYTDDMCQEMKNFSHMRMCLPRILRKPVAFLIWIITK